MNTLEMERYLITSSLAFAAITTWYCPCGNPQTGENFLSCHLQQVVLATAVPLIVILYVNKNNLSYP